MKASRDGGWDVVCVGAGITSLAFGAHMAARHPQARVLVLDKHTVPGGYASEFVRPKAGAVFDCSLHKLTGTRAGGNLKRMFDELGLSDELRLIDHPDFFEACLPCEALDFGNSPQAVQAALAARFPSETDNLQRFFAEVETHGRNSYYQFQIMDGSYDVDFKQLRLAHRQLKGRSVSDALAERFVDGHLIEILGATSVYVGGYPEDLSYLYFLHVVYASLYLGNAYVAGRSQQLSDALVRRIRGAGGEVVLGSTVRRIVPGEGGRPHQVHTLRDRFDANAVYINAAPHHAMGKLFDDDDAALAPVRARLEALKPSRPTTTLYLTTDRPPAELGLGSVETMIFNGPHAPALAQRLAANRTPDDAALAERAFWWESPVEVTNYHALDPSGGHVVCVNVLDAMAHWAGAPASRLQVQEATRHRSPARAAAARQARHRGGTSRSPNWPRRAPTRASRTTPTGQASAPWSARTPPRTFSTRASRTPTSSS